MPGTVTVACKMPNGLLLRLFEARETDEFIQGGGTRRIKEYLNVGDPVRIQGNASPHGKSLLDVNGDPIPMYHGFATTMIDAEFWEQWYEQNKHSDLVRNGLIFAHAKSLDVRAEAKEKRDQTSGLERLSGADDKRVGNRRTKAQAGSISAIAPDDGK